MPRDERPLRLVYLPWPMVMDIADKLDANRYTQLAREARLAVWTEAERRWAALSTEDPE
jgi:hypothetical protein